MEESRYSDRDWKTAKQQSRSRHRIRDTTIAIGIVTLQYNNHGHDRNIAIISITIDSRYNNQDCEKKSRYNNHDRNRENRDRDAKFIIVVCYFWKRLPDNWCLHLFICRAWWRGNIEQFLKSCLSKQQRCNDIITGTTDALMAMQISEISATCSERCLHSCRKTNTPNSRLKMERK